MQKPKFHLCGKTRIGILRKKWNRVTEYTRLLHKKKDHWHIKNSVYIQLLRKRLSHQLPSTS